MPFWISIRVHYVRGRVSFVISYFPHCKSCAVSHFISNRKQEDTTGDTYPAVTSWIISEILKSYCINCEDFSRLLNLLLFLLMSIQCIALDASLSV